MQRPLIDPSLTYIDATEDHLYSLWIAWYPGGSGPLGAMKTICALVESMATQKGYDISKWPERHMGQR